MIYKDNNYIFKCYNNNEHSVSLVFKIMIDGIVLNYNLPMF